MWGRTLQHQAMEEPAFPPSRSFGGPAVALAEAGRLARDGRTSRSALYHLTEI
jgi:hypothetical protein